MEIIDFEIFVKVMDVMKYIENGEVVEKENIIGSVNFGNFLSIDEKMVSKMFKVQLLKGVGGEYFVFVNFICIINGVLVFVDKMFFELNGEEEVMVMIMVLKGVIIVGEV